MSRKEFCILCIEIALLEKEEKMLKSLEPLDPGGCPCYPEPEPGDLCVCCSVERVLRLYAGGVEKMPPMTPEQRYECLEEIASVEGYERDDYVGETDQHLASGVLYAWVDYCRDKGLL
jgi:hypothetical protein